MKLDGKVAIVTGAGRGIGKEICLTFSREGATVIAVDIDPKGKEEVIGKINSWGRRGLFIKADVGNSSEVIEMARHVMEDFGRIDILVNNAGIVFSSPLLELSEEIWDRVFATNLKGQFLCCREVGKFMIRQEQGNIINVASMAGHSPYSSGGAYSASKAGVIMFTKQLAIEWAKYGIRVNAISPGLIRTPMNERVYEDKVLCEKRIKLVPLRRIGTPEDISRVALFLATEDSSYMTGQVLIVDGGYLETLQEHLPGRSDSK
jgi:NAD(P)-dependent dehydrogenase (short-subunit alcohol dehydrogenase family)